MRAAIYMRVGNPGQLAVRHQAEVLTRQIRACGEIMEGIMAATWGLST